MRAATRSRPAAALGGTAERPLISVVIDNYNYAHYLPQAIDSALGQTYANTEVVVVDDGSTDASRAIIASYGQRIVPVLKANGGQASAFNAGFARARGELVMFLDADDVLLPHIAQRAVELFQSHPEIGTLQFRLAVVDAAGALTGAFIPPRNVTVPGGDGRACVVMRPGQVSAWPSTSGTTYSARALAQVLPMPEDPSHRIICADGYVRRAATLVAPFLVFDEVGAHYRVHGSNTDPFVGRSTLALEAVHRELAHWAEMYACLEQFAESRAVNGGLRSSQRLQEREVPFITLRMVSRRLDPARHPWHKDVVGRLAWRGARAVAGCPDLSLALKCLSVAWFAAIALAPRPLAHWLAERKLCPDSRPGLGSISPRVKVR